jgi:hypothetical protein
LSQHPKPKLFISRSIHSMKEGKMSNQKTYISHSIDNPNMLPCDPKGSPDESFIFLELKTFGNSSFHIKSKYTNQNQKL